MKIGALRWSKMRVLKATTNFKSVAIELDKSFLGGPHLPGLEAYASQESEEEEDAAQPQESVEEEALAANGFQMIAYEDMCGQDNADNQETADKEDEDMNSKPGQTLEEALYTCFKDEYGEDVDLDHLFDPSIPTKVTVDEDGDMLVALDPAFEQPVTAKSLQYIHSMAYQDLAKSGLASTPPVTGCGLMYNRPLGFALFNCIFSSLTTCFRGVYL